MQVRDGMSEMVLTVGPGHTLRAVARLMSQRQVGAAVVMDPDGHGPGIITERDVLVVARRRARTPTASASPTTSPATSCSRRPTGRSRRPPRRWCAAASAT